MEIYIKDWRCSDTLIVEASIQFNLIIIELKAVRDLSDLL